MFSDRNGIKPEISKRKITGKVLDTLKLNNTLVNNSWVEEYVSKEIKKHIELNKNENISNFVGYS